MSTRKTEHNNPIDRSLQAIRQRAEEMARRNEASVLDSLQLDDGQRLLHELQVHQIELELQNEELRRTQHDLEISEISLSRYFDLYDLAPTGYLTLSEQGQIQEANLTAAAMLGLVRNRLINQPISLFVLKEDQYIYNLLRKQLQEQLSAGSGHASQSKSCELRMQKQNGTSFWALLIASTAPPVVRVVIHDITVRKQLAESLRESELNYRTLADSGQVLIWKSRSDKLCDYFNKAWLDFTGRTYEQEFGNGWAEGVHPDDFQRCLDIYIAAFDKREAFSMDYRLRRHDGVYRWLQDDGCPRNDLNGTFVGYIGYCLDITERKRVEEELGRKNVEIEQFIYTVSHDLRSPLVTVKTFLSYLEQDISTGNSNRIGMDMGYLHSAADRMEALLNELLDMSRLGRDTVLNDIVTYRELLVEAMDAVAGQISTGRVDLRVNDADLTLCGDRRRLLQIWQNLLDNALKYMGDQAEPLIEIGVDQQEGETVFYVSDNGIGIAPEYQKKVFGIFEKLDRKTSGVGMGLTMVRRIVEMYGGHIRVESAGEGQGSCFRFTLPAAVASVGSE